MTVDEIVTLAMLLDDVPPRQCHVCHGDGLVRFYPWKERVTCTQCGGVGCDWIGMKTRTAMRKTNGEENASIENSKNTPPQKL